MRVAWIEREAPRILERAMRPRLAALDWRAGRIAGTLWTAWAKGRPCGALTRHFEWFETLLDSRRRMRREMRLGSYLDMLQGRLASCEGRRENGQKWPVKDGLLNHEWRG